MEIRWLDDALADTAEIYRHIADDDPRAAARMVERIRAAVRSLRQMPQRGRPGRWRGTRELVIARTPYIVPYRVRSRSCASSRRPPLAGQGSGERKLLVLGI
jgi:toxin ParE1/3/4